MSNQQKLTRHAQRKAVFELIFERSFRKDESPSDIFVVESVERGFDGYAYIRDTFLAAEEKADEIDALIREYAVGWRLDRISLTARATLRLAIFELMNTDVPPKVAINEAIEISKEYASVEEAAFVNGILNKFARDKGLLGDSADVEK